MLALWKIYTLCVYMTSLVAYAATVRPEFIIQKAISNLNPHHVTIFTADLMGTGQTRDDIFQPLTTQIPTTRIDLTKLKNTNDNRSLEMPIFRNPRSSTMYVILQSGRIGDTVVSQICKILNEFVVISPQPARPKCLLIFYTDINFSNDWLIRI